MTTYFQLDNQAFEELAADIFDEVDRRETEQGRYSIYCNRLEFELGVFKVFYLYSNILKLMIFAAD